MKPVRFNRPQFSIDYHGGRITVRRPGPPEPPREPTLAELRERRRALEKRLSVARDGNSLGIGHPADVEHAIDQIDEKIYSLLEVAS